MTRLELGAAGGGALKVENLTQPVTFTLPAAAPAAGSQAQCTYWDEAAGARRRRRRALRRPILSAARRLYCCA